MPHRHEDLAAALERESHRLDRLIQDVRLGIGSTARYDELEERAQAIAARIVAPFRAPSGPPEVRITRGRNGGVWAH